MERAAARQSRRARHIPLENEGLDANIQAMGYSGGPTQVYIYCCNFRQSLDNDPRHTGFVPLSFELGETFQFDWNCEYVVIDGLRRHLEVAHTKLAAGLAYVLVAYFT